MSKKNKLTIAAPPPVEPFDAPPFDAGPRHGPDEVQIGQWYWVNEIAGSRGHADENGKIVKAGGKYRWLACVMEVGSNYVGVQAPSTDRGYSSDRVHFDNFEERLTFAPDAEQYIETQRMHYQQRVNLLLAEVREVTTKLGIVPTQQVTDRSGGGEGQNGLVVVSAQPDTKAYKKALIKASETTLPELFKDIKEANAQLARWMIAPTLALTASIGPMEKSIGAVKDRIYTIELYAGLTEDAVQCCEGAPAGLHEKLRIMQRRLYMDEECLANYEAGGMEVKHVKQFDAWLSRPENRDRILPFPRCLVAFRVRRKVKAREHGGNLWNMQVNVQLEDADKKTFLYIRNGEQVWRIECDFEFDAMIVPNKDQFNPGEPMMIHMFGTSVDKMMPRSRWESLVAEEEEQYRKYKEWDDAHPGKNNWMDNPFHNSIGFRFEYKDCWKPFDQTNVYFDDALKEIEREIKRYNRIAVIVQGLFDRSEVLHPHVPVKMWEPDSFSKSVELVYDANTLTYGDPPDFELYRARLNMGITADSVLVGQEDFWMRLAAVKENTRQARDWRNHSRQRSSYVRYKPYGDTGPGLIGKPAEWKARAKKAIFRWQKERGYRGRWRDPRKLDVSVEVPASELLNVSAYKLGDFRQFFADPRTRQEYLIWAPLLLAAEDFKAGKKAKKGTATEYEF